MMNVLRAPSTAMPLIVSSWRMERVLGFLCSRKSSTVSNKERYFLVHSTGIYGLCIHMKTFGFPSTCVWFNICVLIKKKLKISSILMTLLFDLPYINEYLQNIL
jgi:hypothetical protein